MRTTSCGVTRPTRIPALLSVLIVLLLPACTAKPDPTPQEVDEYLAGPAGEPIELDFTFPGMDQPTSIQAKLHGDWVLIEGDIALGTLAEIETAASHLQPHSHSSPESTYWPATNTSTPYVYAVPYVIDDDVFSQAYIDDVIMEAINYWNLMTNVEFVKRTTQTDYVNITTVVEGKCWSRLGRIGGSQTLNLDEDACTRVDTVVHELGHAVGLKHEHQRTDRDEFVRIHLDRVCPAAERSNFVTYWQGIPIGEYDLTSRMHYHPTAFGCKDHNGNRMTTVQSLGDPINAAPRLSVGDLAAVRRIYPEVDLPLIAIVAPEDGRVTDEGRMLTFRGDVVVEPKIDVRSLRQVWSYMNHGVLTTFGSAELGDVVQESFCDGTHVITMSLVHASLGVLGTDTVTVTVNDRGHSTLPAGCAPEIVIDEPIDGSVFAEGQTIMLSASIDDDDPTTDEPLYPVVWRTGDPLTGSIISRGLTGSTRLGVGTHTIYAQYGAARDSVTVEVVEAGTPPTVTITGPPNGAFFNWAVEDGVNSFLEVIFTGEASDAEDGPLPGAALEWEYRVAGEEEYQPAGQGVAIAINFVMRTGRSNYDVRVTATDSDGMTATETIQISILWPPS